METDSQKQAEVAKAQTNQTQAKTARDTSQKNLQDKTAAAEKTEVAFSQATSAQQEAYKKGELPGRQKMAYKVGHVFDIAQTDFPPEEYPKLLSVGVSSVPHRQLPTAKAYGLAEARQGRCKSPG